MTILVFVERIQSVIWESVEMAAYTTKGCPYFMGSVILLIVTAGDFIFHSKGS